MRTLDGKKLKLTSKPTKRDTYWLNGSEISRLDASQLMIDHCQVNRSEASMLTAIYLRDTTLESSPLQTAKGMFWHSLELIG